MIKQNKHVYGLIAFLFLLGSMVFCYRHWGLDVPLKDTDIVNNWIIEGNLKFKIKNKSPVQAKLMIPYVPPNWVILDEYFISHHFGINTNLEGVNRQVVWSLRRGHGLQSLYYRAIFRQTQKADVNLTAQSIETPAELTDEQKMVVTSMIQQAQNTSADTQTFAQNIVKLLNIKNENTKILFQDGGNEKAMIRIALKVLHQANIHALAARCLDLKQQRHAEFKWYLAIYLGQQWIWLNPYTASVGLPHNLLVWNYGLDDVFSVSGARNIGLNLTVSKAPMNALNIAKLRGLQTDSDLLRFSLLQLPVNTQEMYKILLTIPIGAFIILILRNFIGLKTFGTFMPVLIALAFRETHVVWGVSLFTIIVAFGLLVRFYLAQLHLLLVPRLSAILTVVILLMIGISIISQNLGLERGLSVALFPMVILTMTIERMCIIWDERGAADAIKSGVGSLIAALLAYWAMSNMSLQYLLFAFPELLLVLLSLILLLGQYRGYRLFELMRFKALGHKG